VVFSKVALYPKKPLFGTVTFEALVKVRPDELGVPRRLIGTTATVLLPSDE
jgi:hypothetical protein